MTQNIREDALKLEKTFNFRHHVTLGCFFLFGVVDFILMCLACCINVNYSRKMRSQDKRLSVEERRKKFEEVSEQQAPTHLSR